VRVAGGAGTGTGAVCSAAVANYDKVVKKSPGRTS